MDHDDETADGEPVPFKERVKQKLSPLMQARKQAAMYAGWYRDDVFDNWLSAFLAPADEPRQWTQAKVLYENYVRMAAMSEAGSSRTKVGKHARQEIASETQWGRMMATKFPKKRRSKGWFYPVRITREA